MVIFCSCKFVSLCVNILSFSKYAWIYGGMYITSTNDYFEGWGSKKDTLCIICWETFLMTIIGTLLP